MPREVVCAKMFPCASQQRRPAKWLDGVFRKMSLYVASYTVFYSDKTRRIVRCFPVWSHTGNDVEVRTDGREEVCGSDKKMWSQMNG